MTVVGMLVLVSILLPYLSSCPTSPNKSQFFWFCHQTKKLFFAGLVSSAAVRDSVVALTHSTQPRGGQIETQPAIVEKAVQ